MQSNNRQILSKTVIITMGKNRLSSRIVHNHLRHITFIERARAMAFAAHRSAKYKR